MKLGKVLCHHRNVGIAQISIDKLDELGTNAIYNISDYRILIWQPEWLDMVRKQDHPDKDEE